MGGMLQTPTTLRDSLGEVLLADTFDACLDAWVALDHEARAGTTITADVAKPPFSPDIRFPLDSVGIAKAVMLRENMEWP